jgi:NAD(P)H-dependent FMN reductase
MNIAIIGTGNVGGGLAAAATKAGHGVVVSASTPTSAQDTAAKTGAKAAASNAEAVQAADVVVLAVPHGAVAGVFDELGDALTGKVFIDATNPLNDTYSDLTTSGVSAAEQLQQQVPGAKVVKAFNTIFAAGTPARPRAASLSTRSSPATTPPRRRRSPRWPSRSATAPLTRAGCGWPGRWRRWRSSTSASTPATAGPGRAAGSSSARRPPPDGRHP